MEINVSDKIEQRKFGVVMAVAITVLGLIRWAIHGFAHFPILLISIAAVFLFLGLLAPKVLQPVLYVWMKFALAINWFMTRFLLFIAFATMFVPVAIFFRLTGKDPLNRAWLPESESYWEEPEEQPTEIERYLNQF
jgi:predicted membrane protein